MAGLDGLWTMEFKVGKPDQTGERLLCYGVAVLAGQGILGGNSDFYWEGRWQPVANSQIRVWLTAATHSGGFVSDPFRGQRKDWRLDSLSGPQPQPDAGTFE